MTRRPSLSYAYVVVFDLASVRVSSSPRAVCANATVPKLGLDTAVRRPAASWSKSVRRAPSTVTVSSRPETSWAKTVVAAAVVPAASVVRTSSPSTLYSLVFVRVAFALPVSATVSVRVTRTPLPRRAYRMATEPPSGRTSFVTRSRWSWV